MNPHRGEVSLTINGQPQVMRLTLGALAELEATLEMGSLLELIERFESGQFAASDLVILLLVGLRAGGMDIDRATLNTAEIDGGAVAAAQAGALLLKRAFTLPDAGV